MAVKKSELHSTLWASCDELRGGMEPTEYKDYVLLLLFIRYVTDKAKVSKGLITIPPESGFDYLKTLKNKPDIGEKVNIAIAKLAEANNLHGVIDVADFNDEKKLGKGQDLVDTVSKLIGVFENANLNFANNRADGDDILGDAYEFLMRKFSIDAGKSKGQFYTPSEVSRILSVVIGIDKATSNKQTIYDPTCGSGSLLLKAHETAQSATGFDLAIYGQENATNTAALARMNMWLHGSGTADIRTGNTLAAPEFLEKTTSGLKTFDYVVANPPFSVANWKNNVNVGSDPFKRFEYGTPPDKNGDYAFLLHILASLKNTGTGAVILPHGVLFRGNSEAFIRRNLIKAGLIKAIIGLPANLFYGTGIPACILVLDKKDAATRNGIFMIDASKNFTKDGAKNKLRERDIHKVLDAYSNQLDIPKFSRFVPLTEISDVKNDFNLNLPRYIDTSIPQDLQDINAHLNGGIPNVDIDSLGEYWNQFKSLKSQLIKVNREGYSDLKVPAKDIKSVVNFNAEVIAFKKAVHERFEKWLTEAEEELLGAKESPRPKSLVKKLGESLLESFRGEKLIDGYGVYQSFSEFAQETLLDDLYLINEIGWVDAAKLTEILPKKKGEKASTDRVDVLIKKTKYHSELIPSDLLKQEYFSHEVQEIEKAESLEGISSAVGDEFLEEHTGDDGLLKDFVNSKGKITKAELTKALKSNDLDPDVLTLLREFEVLSNDLVKVKEKVKGLNEILNQKLLEKYKKVTDAETKNLAVKKKWLFQVSAFVEDELLERLNFAPNRISVLALRYEFTLLELESKIKIIEEKVKDILLGMGYATK